MVNEKKTHHLEADCLEVTYVEERTLTETSKSIHDEDVIVYNVRPQFVKRVRTVPNKRIKKDK